MADPLRLDRVDDVHLMLAYGHVLDGPAHDVYLLDLSLPPAHGPFDESAYLACLEPVLHAHGSPPDPCVVHVNRTHRNWAASRGEAAIAMSLSTGSATGMDRDSTDAVTQAFRRVLATAEGQGAPALSRAEAIAEARRRVEYAYAEAPADQLAVTDEEHMAGAGMWSVGLVLSTVARFKVRLGFVDGVSSTAHIRRTPANEVVDSVGTEGAG